MTEAKTATLLRLVNDGHMLFAFCVFTAGVVFHSLHRLDSTFIAFGTTILGFVFGHSVMGQKGDAPPPQV